MKTLKEMKWVKYILGGVGAIVAGGAIMMGGVMIGYPAISQLVGLAVAQSSTIWNNVIDAAKGDTQSSGILGMSPYLWNGTSFDRVKGTSGSMNVGIVGAVTPADGYTNPTTAGQIWGLNGLWNGATWDRWYSISATNNTVTTAKGAAYVVPLSTWTFTNVTTNAGTPSANKASGGGSVRNVITSVSGCVAAAATAQPAVEVDLKDGSTVIRSWSLAAVVSSGQCFNESGLNITGTAATAMTLAFAGATAANVIASVNASGYSTP